MVTWGVTDAGECSVGGDHDVLIGATDWMGYHPTTRPALVDDDRPTASSYSRRAGTPITGSTRRLTIPTTTARLHGDETTRLADQSFSVTDGSYRLSCTLSSVPTSHPYASTVGPVTIVAQFQGPATLDRQDRSVQVAFDRPTAVTLRLTTSETEPPTVTVPPTPDGLATGITTMAVAHDSSGPDRSHPAQRVHPPLLTVGDTTDVPDAVSDAMSQTDLELTVPSAFESLFVAAPLAYYLGASVSVGDVDRPQLAAPCAGYERTFAAMPDFQHECASLLRQVFYLDCLARDETPGDAQLLSAHDLDPAALGRSSVAERLARYADVVGPDLHARLPEWHLSTYASPTAEHIPAIPYLLDDLSLVYLPSASEIEGPELLDRTLSAAYRAGTGDVETVDVVEPDLGAGSVHAWLADGAPLDAFKTTPDAYRHRRRYDDCPAEPFGVTVVLNDESMAAEHTAVAEIYRERAADVPIDLTVQTDLTTDELASVIESRNDFLHYIGHCEKGGLRCTDGTLSVESLSESRTRTFFLNACGSYHEGLNLVNQGSLAGAVTLTAVLNEQAAKVGTAFARLLMHGFSIERALRLARRQILMGKDYAVVGDGTDSLVPARGHPAILRLSDHPDGYHITYEALTTGATGRRYRSPFDETAQLCGRPTETTLTAGELVPILERTSLPVVYNGDFHWSSDLGTTL